MTSRKRKTTFVSFLLDETGSMEAIKDDTIGGFNAYLRSLQEAGDDVLFSLVSFNSSHTKKRHVATPIAKVRKLSARTYQPSAMTPLIDAAVKIIKATDEAVRQHDDEPNVVVVMQTDGQENVSVEYTTHDLALLIKQKEAAGWQFVFLGAGLDAFAAAKGAGIDIDARQVVSYGRERSHAMFEAMAQNVGRFARTGRKAELAFSADQRAQVGDVFTSQYLDEDVGDGDEDAQPEESAGRSGRAARKSTAEDVDLLT